MHYIYILRLINHAKRLYYIGFSNDLKRRFREQQNNNEKTELVYYEAYQTEALARTREKKLKQYGRGLAWFKETIKLSLEGWASYIPDIIFNSAASP